MPSNSSARMTASSEDRGASEGGETWVFMERASFRVKCWGWSATAVHGGGEAGREHSGQALTGVKIARSRPNRTNRYRGDGPLPGERSGGAGCQAWSGVAPLPFPLSIGPDMP
ncbi:hypothetical protein GCM10009551_083130 [Nocardiopsis tropica]